MKLRVPALLATVAIGISVAVGASPSAVAEPDAGSTFRLYGGSGEPVISPQEREDLALVAKSLKISEQEAARRYSGQEAFAVAVDQLRVLEPNSFTSAVWGAGAHEEYAGTIDFTSLPGNEAQEVLIDLPIVVRVEINSVLSEVDLLALQSEARDVVASLPKVIAADSSIDDELGTVVVRYESESDETLSADQIIPLLKTSIRAEDAARVLRIEQGGVLEENQTAVSGGKHYANCTAGFTVFVAGRTGISSAAHCPNGNQPYSGVTAVFVKQSSKNDGDVQWSEVGGGITNKFQYTSSGTLRSVTSVSNPVKNSSICYYGRTTGQNCGSVTEVNYCTPSGICKMFRYGPSTAEPGDSGGPFFYGSVAKGITSGFLTNGLGLRVDDYASRVGTLNLLGVAVKTSP